MIDAHAHLTDGRYSSARDVVEEFNAAGGEFVVDSGYDLKTSIAAADNAKNFPNVFFTCGFHPSEAAKYNDLSALTKLCKDEKCLAVGEIGLDYHYPDHSKQAQKELFVAQMRFAHEKRLPIVIHSRDCSADMLDVLTANRELLSDGFLMHCYSESREQAQNYLALGAYFSFGGVITFKNAKKEEIIRGLPIDRLLTETDSPYLTPEPFRGTLNSPSKVAFVCKKMAEILGLTVGEVEDITRRNFFAFYKKAAIYCNK